MHLYFSLMSKFIVIKLITLILKYYTLNEQTEISKITIVKNSSIVMHGKHEIFVILQGVFSFSFFLYQCLFFNSGVLRKLCYSFWINKEQLYKG